MLRKILIILGLIAFDIGLIVLSSIDEISPYDVGHIEIIVRSILNFWWVGIHLFVTPLVIAAGLFVVLIYQHFIRERRIRILLLNFAILIFTPVLFVAGLGAFGWCFFGETRIGVWTDNSTDQALALHLSFYNEQGKQIEDIVMPLHEGWQNTDIYSRFEPFSIVAELIAAPSGETLSRNVVFGLDDICYASCCCGWIFVPIRISKSNGIFSVEFTDFTG